MFLKFNRLLIASITSIFLVISQGGYLWTVQACEVIEVDKAKPIFTKKLTIHECEAYLDQIPKQYSKIKRKGILGEIVAKDVMENKLRLGGKNLVSISTLFRNKGCRINRYIRDQADRGLDDIFVVLGADGWADQRYNPIFHESKYDGRCNLKLRNTTTLCQQLSFQWLDGNLQKTYKRTRRADLCFGGTEVVINSCLDCAQKFRNDILWLKEKLQEGNFIRTASLLCADGRLSIYNVNGS